MEEGGELFEEVLGRGEGDPALRGRAYFEAGLLATWRGDDARARNLHEESLRIADQLASPALKATALTGLARLELRGARNLEEARRLCREALELARESGDRTALSNSLHVGGAAAQMAGDLPAARLLMRERLDVARSLDDLRGVSVEASNLSMVERQLGNLERAQDLAREALSIGDRQGDVFMIPYALNSLAAIAVDRGDLATAAQLLAAAEALQAQIGAEWPPDEKPQFDRSREAARAGLPADEFEKSWKAGGRMSLAEAVAFAS